MPFSSTIFFQIDTNDDNNETLVFNVSTISENAFFSYHKEKSELIYSSNNIKQ